MKDKDIEQLINKYLEGETSPDEEQELALELQRPDIPQEWKAIRLMLGELTLGEAEYDRIKTLSNSPSMGRTLFKPLAIEGEATGVFRVATECGYGPTKGSESPFATVVGERVFFFLKCITSMAAVLLVGLFLYQHLPTENTNEVPHYYTSDFSAGSTLRNVYTGRRHQEKHLSYTQFKTMLYENK